MRDLLSPAMRGRPMAAKNALFTQLPKHGVACLYAAELSNGIVKVGHSVHPRTRMAVLSNAVRREFGCEIVSAHVGVSLPSPLVARAAEARLIQAMGRHGKTLNGRPEFFRCVPFGVAASLVEVFTSQFGTI